MLLFYYRQNSTAWTSASRIDNRTWQINKSSISKQTGLQLKADWTCFFCISEDICKSTLCKLTFGSPCIIRWLDRKTPSNFENIVYSLIKFSCVEAIHCMVMSNRWCQRTLKQDIASRLFRNWKLKRRNYAQMLKKYLAICHGVVVFFLLKNYHLCDVCGVFSRKDLLR